MIRTLFTGIAALVLTTGAAFAQDTYSRTTTTVTRSADDPDAAPAPAADTYHEDTAAVVDDRAVHRERRTVVHEYHDPGAHALGGGVAGAGLGAAIGCLVTIPIGCAPGAAIGAAVGGGTGAIAGAASTPPPSTRVYESPPD
jgi:hypothetical protein